MAYHVPEEETLGREDLAALQERKLRALLCEVATHNRFWQDRFSAVGFDASRDPLEALPLLTRAEVEADQAAHPPYGTNLTHPPGSYLRLHQTSGSTGTTPLRWLDTRESWNWWKRCWGTIYRAADVGQDDRFLFPFSFGPFIGFWGAFEGAADLGCLCLAAGGMTTAARLRYMVDHRATVVCCTPTYGLRMAEVAHAEGVAPAVSAVRMLIVAGEPGGHIPAVRSRLEAAFGARVFDHAGMTEVGPWGFECADDPSGMHVMENEFIAEVVDPHSGAAVDEGDVGELVLTNLGRTGSPVLRYRTGDQVRLTRRVCACGRSFAFLEGGVLGRTDDMLYIRGNNVFPSAVEDVLRGIDGVAEFCVEVDRRSAMTDLVITVEPVEERAAPSIAGRVREAIQGRFHFQPTVRTASVGTLPRYELKARRFVQRKGGEQSGGASEHGSTSAT